MTTVDVDGVRVSLSSVWAFAIGWAEGKPTQVELFLSDRVLRLTVATREAAEKLKQRWALAIGLSL